MLQQKLPTIIMKKKLEILKQLNLYNSFLKKIVFENLIHPQRVQDNHEM